MIIDSGFQLGCLYEPPLPEAGAAYMRYLSRLLNSPPRLLSQLPQNGGGYDETGMDLLMYWEPERPFWQRWLGWTPAIRVVERSPASVLVVRQPRWPLRCILLILRADKTDEAAIQWLRQLAQFVRLDVSVLPIVPPIPVMYRYGSIPLLAEELLASNTYSGAQLRHLASLCNTLGIQSRLLLHNSKPQQRIEWAINASNCDLIVLSHEPYHWLHRRFLGELLRPLLRRTDRPVLIAKNTSANNHC